MKKKLFWEVWFENDKKVKEDFNNYLETKKIKKEIEVKDLIEGHIQKADHNLKFAKSILDLQEFNDWAIVSTYYAIYHASLALCALKGYATKDHSATLLLF
jgi:AAA+ ATPase superfamily predicted ATPase